MIDVSSLTPLQAAIALLIERRGNAGRRVCELTKESKQGKRAIQLALSHLLDCGVVIKIEGDAPRYYTPEAHIDSSMVHVDSSKAHVRAPLAHTDSPTAHVRAPLAHTDSPTVTHVPPSFPEKVPTTNLTLVNLTEPNLTNKQDFENSFETHAQSKPKSGKQTVEAGPAVGVGSFSPFPENPTAPTAPLPQQAPKKPPRRKKTPKPTPSTPEPENAPESPLPRKSGIYDLLPEHAREAIKANVRRSKTKNAEPPPKPTVVITSENPLASLHTMLATMEGKFAVDPDYAIRSLDAVGTETPPMIPMYDAFVKYLKIIDDAYRDEMKAKDKPLLDFVLHRAAYIFTIDTCKRNEEWKNPMMFVEFVRRTSGTRSMHLKMLGLLKDHYKPAGLGWDEGKVLADKDVYRQETLYADLCNKGPRDELFRSFTRTRRLLEVDTQNRQAKPDRALRIDPPHVPRHPILSAIADSIGERFDLWFGQDTVCDDKSDPVVFTVRNKFAKDSIRRHCDAAIRQTLTGMNLNPDYKIESQEKETTMSDIESKKAAMASANACNLEYYLANIDKFIVPIVNDRGEIHFKESQPRGLHGEDLKAFLKAKNKRVKELFDAHYKQNQAVLETA